MSRRPGFVAAVASDAETLRRPLDLLAAAGLALTILAAAAGSSVEIQVVTAAKPIRGIALAILGIVVVIRAIVFRTEWRIRGAVMGTLGGFCLIALVSRAWSVYPLGLRSNAIPVCVAIVVATVLAGGVRSTATANRLVVGMVTAIGGVALAGLVLLAVDPSRAVQPATVQYPARFQGFEQNPNTAAMLLAIGTPLVFAPLLAARRVRARVGLGLLLFAFTAEVVASGSRGGLVAGFGSLLIVSAVAHASVRRRIGFAVMVLASFILAAWITTIPHASRAPSVSATSSSPGGPRARGIDAETVIPLDSEIGGPWWTRTSGEIHRTLLSSGTRTRALVGALEQAAGRPLLGYGFGAEQVIFVNRYYGFNSGNPENGYIGLLLQVGVVGLGLFVAAAAACLGPPFWRFIVHPDRGPPWFPGVAGAASAGLLIGVSQSYFHAAGNIASVAFWTALLVASAAGTRSDHGEMRKRS